MQTVYLCQDNIEGIFTAIYEAWRDALRGIEARVALEKTEERRLFCEYILVQEEERKINAVTKLICTHMGKEVYEQLCIAALAEDGEKAMAIFGVMQAAKLIKNPHHILSHLSEPYVGKVFELLRSVGNEAHHYKGFVRFRELENGVLFSEINPKNQILACIAEHFADRLPQENWLIYDKVHEKCLVHIKAKGCFFMDGKEISEDVTKAYSDAEMKFVALWKGFCKSISIKERENRKLQRGNVPLRFQQDMVEFMKMDTI